MYCPKHQAEFAERLGPSRNYYWPQGDSHFGASEFERVPRFWLYYAVTPESCAAYRTAEACAWAAVGAWALDDAQAVSDMDGRLAALGAPVTFIRGLYDPHARQWAAWSVILPGQHFRPGTSSVVRPAPWGESIEI